ncbi:MAG: hypothetical protein GXO22_05035 [Aquificae bacterium]|nr:hypothetical protein [Aquificota bacterium]
MKITKIFFMLFVFVGFSYGFGVSDFVKNPSDTFFEIVDEPLEEMPDFCFGESIEGRFDECFEDEDELHQVAGRAWGNMYKDMIDAGIIDEETLNESDSWFPFMPEITGWQADIKIYPQSVRINSGSTGAVVVVVNKGLEPVVITELDIDGEDKDSFEIVKENCIGKPLSEFSTAGCGIVIKAYDAGEADLRIFFNIVGVKKVPMVKEGEEGGCSFSSAGNNWGIFMIFGVFFIMFRRVLV